MSQQNEQNGMTVDQAAEHVMQSLERAVGAQLQEYARGVDAINKTSILASRMATQQLVLGVLVRQRLGLQKQLCAAAGQPLLELAIEAQTAAFDEQLVEALTDIGVPAKVATKQIETTAAQIKRLEVVERDSGGRIRSLTTNGAH